MAAYNAALIGGLRKRYSTIEKIAKSCGYDPKVGIFVSQLWRTIDKLGIQARYIKPKSPESMERSLRRGNAFVVAYNPDGIKSGHVITLVMDLDGNIRIINPGRKYARTWTRFKRNIAESGMKEFYVYEITNKRLARRNANPRSA